MPCLPESKIPVVVGTEQGTATPWQIDRELYLLLAIHNALPGIMPGLSVSKIPVVVGAEQWGCDPMAS